MGEVITYKNEGTGGVFSQIRLASGERILLSMAQTGFRVTRLFLGIIPTQTLWEIPQGQILGKLTDHSMPDKHPLDVAIQMLKNCENIADVRRALESL
ncbi:MAG TPA: hypothetical protein VGK89_01195 [Candidatus Eisenbacteria bacterium]